MLKNFSLFLNVTIIKKTWLSLDVTICCTHATTVLASTQASV